MGNSITTRIGRPTAWVGAQVCSRWTKSIIIGPLPQSASIHRGRHKEGTAPRRSCRSPNQGRPPPCRSLRRLKGSAPWSLPKLGAIHAPCFLLGLEQSRARATPLQGNDGNRLGLPKVLRKEKGDRRMARRLAAHRQADTPALPPRSRMAGYPCCRIEQGHNLTRRLPLGNPGCLAKRPPGMRPS